MKKQLLYLLIGACLLAGQYGCSSFLDVKPDEKLAVPSSLDDYAAILSAVDNLLAVPEGEVMSGDHFMTDDDFDAMFCQTNIDLYKWMDSPQIQQCDGSGGWTLAYKNIYHSNVVVNGVEEFEAQNGISKRSSDIKGQGYFNRAVNYFELVQIWGDAFDAKEAKHKLGLPLKYSPDFNERTVRSTLEQTFSQIIADLTQAESLLPETQNSVYFPSKVAAWAYLSRVYLYMHKFEQAALYAEKCIGSDFKLLDFHTVSPEPYFPFKLNSNRELIYARFLGGAYYSSSIYASQVEASLYKLFDDKDLRKSLFFLEDGGAIFFRGDYGGGSGGNFSGPTIGEMYLILAESYSRLGRTNEAMEILAEFLSFRTDEIRQIADKTILNEILSERRKELVYRGVRFGDVKRLNANGAAITLKRSIREQVYYLLPNDPRSTLLIPEDVIRISGIPQNPR